MKCCAWSCYMNCSEKQLWKFGFASLLLAPFVYSLAGVEEWREFLFSFSFWSLVCCVLVYIIKAISAVMFLLYFWLVWLLTCLL